MANKIKTVGQLLEELLKHENKCELRGVVFTRNSKLPSDIGDFISIRERKGKVYLDLKI